MSSREIAALVEARHDSVKRTIERLASRDVIEFPPLVEIPTTTKSITEFRVGKRDSYVIVAQLSPEFTARLVDRWQELEKQVAQPKVPHLQPERPHKHRHGHPRRRLRRRALVRGEERG